MGFDRGPVHQAQFNGKDLREGLRAKPCPLSFRRREGHFQILLFLLLFLHTGCATIFGWKIHAPGLLSSGFEQKIKPVNERIALYLPPETLNYESRDRGGRLADPQTYYVGEALGPMFLEGFQAAFNELIFLETEPTPKIMARYAIPRLAMVRVKDFKNRVTLRGQGVMLVTETVVLDPDLKPLARFEARGASDARKVFAKRGGPEVNLNAAIENNVLAVVQQLQDWKP